MHMTTLKQLLIAFLLLAQCSLSAQAWVQKASLPFTAFGRHHPVTFAINGYGYVLGGTSSQLAYLSDFYRYDPVANTWETLPSFPGPPRSYSYAVVYEGKAYMGFGFGPTSDMSDMWEFDPETNIWTEKSLCPGDGRGHPAYVEVNGKVYVGLGGSSMGNLNDFWEYDIATDLWAQIPDLPSHKRHHPFYFSVNDMMYAGFGHGNTDVGGSTIYNDLYRYDPVLKEWERMDDFPAEPRVAGTQFSLNGKGYVLSGEGQDHYYLEEGEFWEYEPNLDSWTQLPSVPGSGRWAPGSFVIGNTAYFTCGTALLSNGLEANQRDLWAYEFEGGSISTNSPQMLAIDVYPNPTQGVLFVRDEQNAAFQYQLFSADGRLVQSGSYQPSTGILLNKMPTGVYELRCTFEDAIRVAKFMKQ